MRAAAIWASTSAPALVLLGLHAATAHGSRHASETTVTVAPVATDVCEFRTINYITHSLPQQCLRTSWTSPSPTATDNSTAHATVAATEATVTENPGAAQHNATAQEQDFQEELAASSFMSFEEWKEMMLRKSGQDPSSIKAHKQREPRERDPGGAHNADAADSFGEEGEISLDFDALAEKVSEITSSAGEAVPKASQEAKEEQVLYDDGKTQYYRSKDAGKTCKERFSYASFDAGATVLKTSPGAKNAKAILVENKDSYMLLECRTKNKFVIVELSDDILVDTVVIANFEFFSSMIRQFRVSVSDRYPVKLDKWVDLGTFEARNSRDIQAFLIEHPQIYTKYIRIEFLSHWGKEFYCPVSLLRVHGTRMLDTWKEPSHDDEPEQLEGSAQAPVPEAESQQVQETASADNSSAVAQDEPTYRVVTETGLSPWRPYFQTNFSLETCELRSPTTHDPTPVESGSGEPLKQPGGAPESVSPRPSAAARAEDGSGPSASSEPASPEAPVSGQTARAAPSTAPSAPSQPGGNSTASNAGQRQPDARPNPAGNSTAATATTPRNRTSTVSSASASPTVQESFFKTVSKRLQLLESNTSLSLQYIEEQSRFLQEVLIKMERKQINRVDSFLDTLNKTVLSELHNVRAQYDQIWQSTVLALETQREQSQREIVALTSRLNILADEVVFQKRMAILQSVLLLACLVLVIFSRGGLAAIDNASFAAFPPPSSAYRRYGYAYGHAQSDSLSGMSVSGSPPPDSQQAAANSASLAASALPHHLYPAAPSSSSASFKDKSLPLTPPSEYSRESTPATARHLNRSPESSFYDHPDGADRPDDMDVDTPPRLQDRQQTHPTASTATAAVTQPRHRSHSASSGSQRADADTSSIETDADRSSHHAPPSPPHEDEAGSSVTNGQATHHADLPSQTCPRPIQTRSAQLGGLRKPLPALPEDPS